VVTEKTTQSPQQSELLFELFSHCTFGASNEVKPGSHFRCIHLKEFSSRLDESS
jgi:hypothetical protein